MSWGNTTKIVKKNGQCWNKSKWMFCPYWRAKISVEGERAIGYRCSLFDEDKEGYASLTECNTKYGETYEGNPT